MKRKWLLLLAALTCAVLMFAQKQDREDKTAPAPAFFMHSLVDRDAPITLWGKGAADLNADNRPDLIVGGFRKGGIVWYENPGWTKHLIDTAAKICTDIEVARIDRDDKPDVIAIIVREGITWYQNPDWKPHQIIKGVSLHDIEAADFDRDGDIDIIGRNQNLSSNASGATLYLFRQESPDIWSSRSFPIPDGEGLKASDIDRDGDADIVINGTWLENRGDMMTDWPAHVFGSGWKQDKVYVDAGDLNGDGRRDIVLSPSEPKGKRYRISWFESPPAPKSNKWVEHVIEQDIETVQHFTGIADFNMDGEPDIATASMLQGDPPQNVTIYLNGGKAIKWTKQVIGTTGNHSMRIVDVDGNGAPDLFGGNHQDNKVELWRNMTPKGKLSLDLWQKHVIDMQKPWKGVLITASDLDGNGLKDIVTGPAWYKNPGSAAGTWECRTIGKPLNNMAAVCDFDSDGFNDVLGTRWQGDVPSNEFVWAKNDGEGNFTIHSNIDNAVGDFLQGVAVDRFTPFGSLEIALSWHNGTGRGVQMIEVPRDPVNSEWPWRRISELDQQEELTSRDLDGDNYKDIILGTRWLHNEKTGWKLMPLGDTTKQVDRHRDADINRDGRLDVVLGFLGISVPGRLVWFEMSADLKAGNWTEHVIASDVIGPMSIDVEDLDGDSDIDVVVGEHNLKDPTEARLLVFENIDGKGGQWKQHEISRGEEHHDGAQLADIDNDGDLDIISIGWGHPRVLLYENKAIDMENK